MPAEKKTGKKARWSASKKAAAKKKPRPARRTDRDEYRPARDERPERQDRRGRDERPARDDRPSHGSRGDRDRDRDRRPAKVDRDGRPAREPRRWERDDRDERRGPRREDRDGARRPAREDRRGDRDERAPRRPHRDHPGHRRFDGSRAGGPGRFEQRDRFDRRDRPERTDRVEQGIDPEAERLEADTWTKATRAGTTGPVDVAADNGFAALGLPERIVERLARDGITTPFPIQEAAIPDALAGRDVLGRGQTGSGKTLAFGLPLLARLADGDRARAKRPHAVVLVPTRELAMQVSDALEPLVHVLGLRHRLVAGGLSYTNQISSLERGVDVLVATPGRLADLMERGAADLSAVRVAVLDEADHMADMGFLPEVTAILDAMPEDAQRLLFSATLDRGVDGLVERYLTDPVTHSTNDATASVSTMDHHVLLIDPQHKKQITALVANREGRTVVFARTKLGADRIARQLRESGVVAAALHGGLAQGARNKVLGAFREGRVPVLVATDVAARGIHVDEVSLVLQQDPPADHKDYLHRAGRTARAGERGAVVTLALPHQRKGVERMLEAAGVDAAPVRTAPGSELLESIGAREPSGEALSETDFAELLRPADAGRGRGGRGGERGRGGQPGRGGRGGPRRSGGHGGTGRRGGRHDGGHGQR